MNYSVVKNPLIWIDCEMTGLDIQNDVIIEIYCLITDGNLKCLDKHGWGTVVHQSKEKMDKMGKWCTKTHGHSGLTAAVLNSKTTPEEAADGLLKYIQKFIPQSGLALLAGNSVHVDKEFLRQEPYRKIIDYLHYRIFDVSTLKMASGLWSRPRVFANRPRKELLHKAKNDILESIAEAEYYKVAIFQARNTSNRELINLRSKNRKA